jgi:hypothetical protein
VGRLTAGATAIAIAGRHKGPLLLGARTGFAGTDAFGPVLLGSVCEEVCQSILYEMLDRPETATSGPESSTQGVAVALHNDFELPDGIWGRSLLPVQVAFSPLL